MNKDIFDVLVEISEIMNSTLESDELLHQILTIAEKFIKVKRVSLMLIEGGFLKVKASTNLDIHYRDISIPLGSGISGKVAKTGEPQIVNNTSATGDESGADELGYETQSYLSIPIKIKNKIIGVLNLTGKDNNLFTTNDVKIAHYIASQCALTIDRLSLYEEKRKSEHLKVIGKFTSSIAHDMKNLLQIVQSYVELMEIEMKGDAEINFYVESICAELKLIHGLTLDILDFSNKQIKLHKSPVRLSEILNDVEKHAKIITKLTGISFEMDFDRDVTFECDKEKIFRVFFNLINNAVEAVNENGKIKFLIRVDDKCINFDVVDNGKGIAPENIEKIFDPFFTSGKIKGTGLGLAVVKEIIEAHNGEITADSKQGEFTKFSVRLPLG